MTYYGRWTYKYEIASEKGAAAALIVHETGPAGYPYAVVQGWAHENFDIAVPGGAGRAAGGRRGLALARPGRRPVFQTAGQDLDTLKKAAARKRLPPRRPRTPAPTSPVTNTPAVGPLEERRREARRVGPEAQGRVRHLHRPLGPPRPRPGAEGRPDLQRRRRQRLGHGRPAGDRPRVHEGRARRRSGRSSSSPSRPRRRGLLGAKYYAAHPLYPLEKTLAEPEHGRDQPLGQDPRRRQPRPRPDDARRPSSPRPRPRRAARSCPTPSPRRGSFTAPITSSSSSKGVPAVNARGGVDYVGKPAGFGLAEARRVHEERLPQGQRRGETRLGPLRRPRRPAPPDRGRLPRGAGPSVPRMAARTEFRERRRAIARPAPPARP